MIRHARKTKRYSVRHNRKKNEAVYGLNRMGKSSLSEGIGQEHYDAEVKVWDLWDANNREEPAFWNIPRDGSKKGTPCKVLIPLTETLPDSLPSVYQPFTIPISNVDLDTWQVFTGSIGKAHLPLSASLNVKSIHGCILRLNEISRKKEFKTDKVGLRVKSFGKIGLASFSQPLNSILDGEVGILANDDFPLSLNLKYERRHPEWITGVSYKSVRNPIVRLFIFLYLFKKIFELQRNNPKKLNLVIIREFADVCPAKTTNNSPEDIVRREIASIVKQSMGSNLKLLIDVQSPSNVYSDTRNQIEHVVYAFRLSSNDVSALLSGPGGSRLDFGDTNTIKGLKTGEFVEVDVEEPPPCLIRSVPYESRTGINPFLRHHHKEPSDNFFGLWSGEWNNWKSQKRDIRDLIISEIRKVEEIEKKKAEEKKKTKKPEKSLVKIERMKKLKMFIKKNPDATRKEIANEIGVSARHLYRYLSELES